MVIAAVTAGKTQKKLSSGLVSVCGCVYVRGTTHLGWKVNRQLVEVASKVPG